MEAGLIIQSYSGGQTPTAVSEKSDNRSSIPQDPDALKALILRRLDEEQAVDIVMIDLAGKSDVADAMIVASGRSQRHVGAIADKITGDIKELGSYNPAVEGLPAADWVLIDAGDIVLHLFRPEVRSFYNLERIWAPEIFGADPEHGGYALPTDAVSAYDYDAEELDEPE